MKNFESLLYASEPELPADPTSTARLMERLAARRQARPVILWLYSVAGVLLVLFVAVLISNNVFGFGGFALAHAGVMQHYLADFIGVILHATPWILLALAALPLVLVRKFQLAETNRWRQRITSTTKRGENIMIKAFLSKGKYATAAFSVALLAGGTVSALAYTAPSVQSKVKASQQSLEHAVAPNQYRCLTTSCGHDPVPTPTPVPGTGEHRCLSVHCGPDPVPAPTPVPTPGGGGTSGSATGSGAGSSTGDTGKSTQGTGTGTPNSTDPHRCLSVTCGPDPVPAPTPAPGSTGGGTAPAPVSGSVVGGGSSGPSTYRTLN